MAVNSLSKQRLQNGIRKDHWDAAKAGKLVYVNGPAEGIIRHKKAKGYSYHYKGKTIKDKEELARIKKLAIPPSWSNVWICPNPSGHIQATGLDLNGRKQYRYHADWNAVRSETKFHRLFDFGKSLPLLRKKVRADISKKDLTAEKVVATTVKLMEETSIRIGNNGYEKLYGSYGLTTLKDKHVTVSSDKAVFCFTGKKGIEHRITLKNRKLAKIIKQCRDIPGKELFQYYCEDGVRKSIDSGMVNTYIKEATQSDFSAKDFRTWAGSLHAMQCFYIAGQCNDAASTKKMIVSVLEEVSKRLGNTPGICKKYYVHPLLIAWYEDNKFFQVVRQVNGSESSPLTGLSKNERILMKLLKRFG